MTTPIRPNVYKFKIAAGGILPPEVATLPLAVGTGGTSVYPPNGQNISNANAGYTAKSISRVRSWT